MDCIDLRPVSKANRWRWHLEPSFAAERDPREREHAGWYVEVLCRYGLIYPWGGDVLLAYTNSGSKRVQLEALGLEYHQRGHKEATLRFRVDQLEAVAEVLLPRMRRLGRIPPPHVIEAGRQTLQKLRDRRLQSLPQP